MLSWKQCTIQGFHGEASMPGADDAMGSPVVFSSPLPIVVASDAFVCRIVECTDQALFHDDFSLFRRQPDFLRR